MHVVKLLQTWLIESELSKEVCALRVLLARLFLNLQETHLCFHLISSYLTTIKRIIYSLMNTECWYMCWQKPSAGMTLIGMLCCISYVAVNTETFWWTMYVCVFHLVLVICCRCLQIKWWKLNVQEIIKNSTIYPPMRHFLRSLMLFEHRVLYSLSLLCFHLLTYPCAAQHD